MPTETKRRGVSRWRGVVWQNGKIAASKWFGCGEKERRKAIIWEEQKRKEIEEEQKNGTVTESSSLAKWSGGYLDEAKRRCAKKTYQEKCRAFRYLARFVRKHTDSKDGNCELSLFTPSFALSYLQEQYDKRSGYAANKDRKNLSTAWDWGKKFISGFPNLANPFASIERYPEERSPRYVPPEEDFWKVLGVAKGQDKVMLLAFMHLAARRGEIFRLKMSDIDFHNEQVRLTTKKTRDGSARLDWIPMTKELRNILLKWWQERPYKQSEYLFTMLDNTPSRNNEPGAPYRVRQHVMKKLCKRAGVKAFGWHAIRHLTAVILYKSGEPVSKIQKILRHQHPTTTERYVASLGFAPDQMRESLEVLSNRGPAKVIPLLTKGRAS